MESLKIRRNKIQPLYADRQMSLAAGMKGMRNAYIIFIGNYELNGSVGKLWCKQQNNINL